MFPEAPARKRIIYPAAFFSLPTSHVYINQRLKLKNNTSCQYNETLTGNDCTPHMTGVEHEEGCEWCGLITSSSGPTAAAARLQGVPFVPWGTSVKEDIEYVQSRGPSAGYRGGVEHLGGQRVQSQATCWVPTESAESGHLLGTVGGGWSI